MQSLAKTVNYCSFWQRQVIIAVAAKIVNYCSRWQRLSIIAVPGKDWQLLQPLAKTVSYFSINKTLIYICSRTAALTDKSKYWSCRLYLLYKVHQFYIWELLLAYGFSELWLHVYKSFEGKLSSKWILYCIFTFS